MSKELQKKLGFWSCLSVGVGLVVASSTLVSLGQGMGIAGAGFVIAMLCAWVLQHFSAQSYSELSCMMPSAGGIRSYTRVAMGALPAIVATISGFLIPNMLAGPTELAVAGTVISENFISSVNPMVWGIVILSVLMLTNLIGVDIFAKFQMFFAITMMVSLSILGIIGLCEFGLTPPDLPDVPFNPMGWDVIGLTALAVWLYIGIEFVAPLAEETINPNKNIPRAMTAGLIMIFSVNLLYGFASLKYVSMADLSSSNAPHILVANAILGSKGTTWIAIVSVLASASSINTVVGVVPRMLYGMGLNGELPKIFGKIHGKFKTPFAGILFMSSLIAAFYLGGIAEADNLIVYILAACCSWFITYIIAHVNVMILRKRYPDAERPYKTPFYPIPQILGCIGFIYCIFHISPVPEMAGEVYTIAGGLVGLSVLYAVIWLKFVKKIPLFEPIPLDQYNLAIVNIKPHRPIVYYFNASQNKIMRA